VNFQLLSQKYQYQKSDIFFLYALFTLLLQFIVLLHVWRFLFGFLICECEIHFGTAAIGREATKIDHIYPSLWIQLDGHTDNLSGYTSTLNNLPFQTWTVPCGNLNMLAWPCCVIMFYDSWTFHVIKNLCVHTCVNFNFVVVIPLCLWYQLMCVQIFRYNTAIFIMD
jgi:hypothetical protein